MLLEVWIGERCRQYGVDQVVRDLESRYDFSACECERASIVFLEEVVVYWDALADFAIERFLTRPKVSGSDTYVPWTRRG